MYIFEYPLGKKRTELGMHVQGFLIEGLQERVDQTTDRRAVNLLDHLCAGLFGIYIISLSSFF